VGGERTYEAAGVSLSTAEAIVERLRAAVASTATPQVAGAFGGFAGLYALDERRLLAASTDSVGSKLVLARRAGRLRWCGADLAAHCINDVLTTGAEPLFLLDYVAANRIELEQVADLVEGAAEVCRAAGCAILGGETAELPGIYRDEEIDFCGTCVGVVERDALIDGSRVEAGDLVLGFPSAGIHANGFSLVRTLVGEGDFDADLLLPPTRLYLDDVRALRVRAPTVDVILMTAYDDMPTVVAACLTLVKERAQEGRLTLRTELTAGLPPLRADERAVKQILINLLSNAVKFTPAGGEVTVRARLDDAGNFLLSVADTGIGIAAKDMAKAMAAFSQVDNSLTRKFAGTGLGLPLVRLLAGLHGGDISFESKVGVGTTVTVRLPQSRAVLAA